MTAPFRLDSLPLLPANPRAWLALPELPFGRYLVADLGWLATRRERATWAGVPDLPPPLGNTDNGFVALPTIAVVNDTDGGVRVFRLAACYGTLVRRLLIDQRSGHRQGQEDTLALPCHFVVGDERDVYLAPASVRTEARN